MTPYITKGVGGFYYVRTETGMVECRARGIFRKRGLTPVAGDNVALSADNAAIEEILPRKNVFIRRQSPTWMCCLSWPVPPSRRPAPASLMN